MGKGQDSALWREISRTAAVLSVVVAIYTVGVALASFDQLLGWFNTLLSTVLSVFFVFVIGLAHFRCQTKETDRKKREGLAALLETELGELRRGLLGSRTFVPDEVLEDLRPSASHEIRLNIHHPHPLVIEEAARSGLFGPELTTAMLVLAREMKAHNLYLREATSWSPTWTGPGLMGFTARPDLGPRSSSGCSGATRRQQGWCSSRRRASSRAARRCSKDFPEESMS